MNTTSIAPIEHYFPNLTANQMERFSALPELYGYWNERINVVSRKDIDNLVEHHLLHSLAIAKVINFPDGSQVLDVGTGGGFPGVPLAILFPDVQFTLIDSIGKKIKVVESIVSELNLKNVRVVCGRVEQTEGCYSFIVSRAVTELSAFLRLVKGKLQKVQELSSSVCSDETIFPAIYYLKGGDVAHEIAPFRNRVELYPITNFFSEPFFESKYVVKIRQH